MDGVEIDDDAPSANKHGQKYAGSNVGVQHPGLELLVRKCYTGIKSLLEELRDACPDAEITYSCGHGLSFTTFAYSDLKQDKTSLSPGETLTVRVSVGNIGSIPGEEVVQLYVKDICSSMARPVMELVGFKRVPLAAGEKGNVTLIRKMERDFRVGRT
jgi:hypothetical protein